MRTLQNEEELIELAKKGGKDAMTKLYQGYEGLIVKASHQTHLSVIKEEAVCAAQESFIKAILTFDSSRGVPFPAYAKAKVYGDLRTLFKQYQRQWNREIFPSCSGDTESFWDTLKDTKPTPEAYVTETDFEHIIKTLPPKQQTLLELLYFKNCTQKTAAALMGISQQAAAAMKKRAIASLRAEMMRG